MSDDIKRKAELLVCGIAADACLDVKLIPQKGGSKTTDAEPIVPPFAVAAAVRAENLVPGEDTWRVQMTLTHVTHIDDTPTPEHTKAFGRVVALILGLPTPGEDQAIGITLHGIGLAEADDVEDEERQSAGDVIAFNLFVTGFDPE
jgi:hypothetical protein